MTQHKPDRQHPKPGETYIFMEPQTDPACTDHSCEIDSPDLLFPWINLIGKRVTVTETGHTLAGHPAVKVTSGPVDWHPNILVTLTPEQLMALGVVPAPTAGYFVVGQLWAADSADMPILPAASTDDFPIETATQVEMPKQHTEIVPARCLKDPAVSRDEKRREDRLRKLAAARGLKLRKMRGGTSSKSTGPYLLTDARHWLRAIAGDPHWRIGVSLDEIETALHKQREPQP
ncbi:hypothetical protein ACWCRF_11500 [Streptomyces sp. NPDC002405]